MSERIRRPPREAFALFQPIQTRWADNDAYGHVNNVVFYSYFDTAVNAALIRAGLLDVAGGPTICLVAETRCAFFDSVAFPERLEAGIAIAHLGRSSARYAIGVFADGAPEASAAGEFTHVFVSRGTRRPVPIPPEHRGFLETLRR